MIVAQRRSQLTGRALSRSSTYGFTVRGPDIVTSLTAFNVILNEEIMVAKRNLGQAAINRLEQNFNDAVTPWGESRIAGQRQGVSFSPYGRTKGRNDTGNMVESLAWEVLLQETSTGVETKARFGWIFKFEEYFRDQEEGFVHAQKFDARTTAATGQASFMPSRAMKVEGAQAFPDAIKLVDNIRESFYKQAYNRAIARWRSEGRDAEPGSYREAKKRYERSS